jgi:hypothetical protein
MSGAHEMLEKMEHAGHAGGGHGHGHGSGGTGRMIGITMAVLGVMLAFCAAMVGSARTELIKATVEQATLWSIYQAESTKYRVMEADCDMLHALTPNKAELDRFEEKLASIKRTGGKADDEHTAQIKEAIHVATDELAEVLTPDKEDEEHLKATAERYKHDMLEAREDAEAYEKAIHVHHESSEWYERAQLCAEIGIVIASIALLLSSRMVWVISVLIGLGGAGIVGYTFAHTRAELKVAEEKIEEAKKRTGDIEQNDEDDSAGRSDHKAADAHGRGEHGRANKGDTGDKKSEHGSSAKKPEGPKPGDDGVSGSNEHAKKDERAAPPAASVKNEGHEH